MPDRRPNLSSTRRIEEIKPISAPHSPKAHSESAPSAQATITRTALPQPLVIRPRARPRPRPHRHRHGKRTKLHQAPSRTRHRRVNRLYPGQPPANHQIRSLGPSRNAPQKVTDHRQNGYVTPGCVTQPHHLAQASKPKHKASSTIFRVRFASLLLYV